MGNNTNTQTKLNHSIGQLEVSQADSKHPKLQLTGNINDTTPFSLLLLDELGRLRFEKKLLLEKGEIFLQFDLPDLPAGYYNAWIEMSGKTYIRNLHLEKKTENWLSRLKKLVT